MQKSKMAASAKEKSASKDLLWHIKKIIRFTPKVHNPSLVQK